jgi:hypothetical protein
VRTWPLHAVLALREGEEGEARRGLAAAISAEWAAERNREAAAARAAANGRRLGEAGRPFDGVASAAALRARGRFAERLRAEAAVLAAALAEAERALARARAVAAGRRAALAEASAARRALERHRDGWRAERARGVERAEEESAEDAVSARRAGP